MTRRETVVVVGAGMVGTRFADDLARGDRDRRFDVRLLGAEEHAPYNRLLLSDALAGRADLAALALPLPDPRVTLTTGLRVESVDLSGQTVHVNGGSELAWDHLVLVTGSRPRVPVVPGLIGADLPRGVHVLRTLDDCRDVIASTLNARQAVVVGGGVLGVEAACGLRRRGVAVALVHGAEDVMDRQLDGSASGVLRLGLEDLGVRVRAGAGLGEVVLTDGRASGVRLADGSRLAADLVLLACGVEPDTDLAQRAGLAVDRGVAVDGIGRSTSHARVYAIGDCVAASRGLLAPGWDQAARLAGHLLGTPVAAAGGSAPVRLKAPGLDAVTMGMRGSQATAGQRVLVLSDPQARRHAEVVLDDAALCGATCIGWPEVAATLQGAFERHVPLPLDPAMLLLSGPVAAPTTVSTPTTMPSGTTVCRCNGVTKADVVTAAQAGPGTVDDVAERTRATTGCGGCRDVVAGLCGWLRESSQSALPGREAVVAAPKPERTAADMAAS